MQVNLVAHNACGELEFQEFGPDLGVAPSIFLCSAGTQVEDEGNGLTFGFYHSESTISQLKSLRKPGSNKFLSVQ